MSETTTAAETGDRPQDWTPEQAAPVFASILFPDTASDRSETSEPTPSPEAPAEPADTPEPEAEEEAASEEDATDSEAESDEPTDAPPDPSQPRLHRVTLDDGTEEEVQEDALVEAYRRKKAQIADYTRKAQAVAEERKTFEAEQAAVRAERQRYADLLQQLEAAITPQAAPDWATLKAELPPDQFAAQWAEWQMGERERETVRAEREKAQAQVAADRAKALQEQLAAERQKLLEAVPEWQDETKYREGATALAQYLTESYGFTPQEIAATTRHELLVLARKAMLYDTMQKIKPKLEQQAAQKIKPATPGAATPKKRPSDAERAATRLARTGRVEDAVPIFKQFV